MDSFPVGEDWTFDPPERMYPLLNSDQVDENYVGIVYGDVSGNWYPYAVPKPVLDRRKIIVTRMDAPCNDRLAILVNDMAGVLSGEITLSFDSSKLRPIEVTASDLTADYLLAGNIQTDMIKLSFAGAESQIGGGRIAEVAFEPIEEDVDVLSAVSLTHAQLNEGMIAVRIGTSEVLRTYALLQNCPNPFNPQTAIAYDVAKSGTVRLFIYALNGQRIRTLVDGDRPTGSYSVVWDGLNDRGKAAPSGVYLCEMVAGKYRAVRKMTLLR